MLKKLILLFVFISSSLVFAGEQIAYRYLDSDKSNLEATFTLNYPADEIWAVLVQYEESPEFLPNTKKVTILENEGSHKTTKTVVKSGPFELSYTCSINENRKNYTIVWKQVDGPFKTFHGTWHLEPVGDKSARVVYSVQMIHPMLPKNIKNSLIKDSIPEIKTRLNDYMQNH